MNKQFEADKREAKKAIEMVESFIQEKRRTEILTRPMGDVSQLTFSPINLAETVKQDIVKAIDFYKNNQK